MYVTCCGVDGEKSLRIARHDTIWDFMIQIFVIIGGIKTNDFRARWAVLGNQWIINRLLCEWDIIVFIFDFNVDLWNERSRHFH